MISRNEELALTFSEMIQCETVSHASDGPAEIQKFYRFRDRLKELFPSLWKTAEYEDFDGSIVLCWKGREEGKLPFMFMSHQDTVEAEGEWKYPPFSGTVADGKIYGRGTLDTKCGIFFMYQAAEELIREGFVPSRDIYFVSTRNEECTGLAGDQISKEFLRRGLRFELVLDEGGYIMQDPFNCTNKEFAMAAVAEKNYSDLRFYARGEGGHASVPPKNSPLVRLGRFMAEVEDSDLFTVEITPTLQEMLLRMAPFMPEPYREKCADPAANAEWIKENLPKLSPKAASLMATSIAFTMAKGSDAYNVMPTAAWVFASMRISHHQGAEASREAVRKIAEKYDVFMDVEDPGYESGVASTESTGFRFVEEAVEAVYPGLPVVPYIMTGGTDSRYMTRLSDCVIKFMPARISEEEYLSIHAPNECMKVEVLSDAVETYRYLMKR